MQPDAKVLVSAMVLVSRAVLFNERSAGYTRVGFSLTRAPEASLACNVRGRPLSITVKDVMIMNARRPPVHLVVLAVLILGFLLITSYRISNLHGFDSRSYIMHSDNMDAFQDSRCDGCHCAVEAIGGGKRITVPIME